MCVWCVCLCMYEHTHMYVWCICTQACVCNLRVTVCPSRAGAVGVTEVEVLQVRAAAEGN